MPEVSHSGLAGQVKIKWELQLLPAPSRPPASHTDLPVLCSTTPPGEQPGLPIGWHSGRGDTSLVGEEGRIERIIIGGYHSIKIRFFQEVQPFMQFLTFQFLKLLKHEIKSKLFYTKQTCIKPSYIHPASEYSNNTQWASQGVIWHNWITLLMVNIREVALQFLCSLHLSSGSIRVVNIY